MNYNDAIVSITHKSCAALAIQCLADSGITDWQTAFNQQISNAKKLGLMPDDFKVIRETLQNFGFVLQGTAIEGMRVSDVLSCLCKLRTAATVFLQVSDYMHLGGNMMAVQINDSKYSYVNTPSDSNFPNMRRFSHVWIRWSDGIDRSPYPRRVVKRNAKGTPNRKLPPETQYYKPFQPNPCSNYIGDCVVRATAGAMNISWDEAIDMLSDIKEVTVNAREVYPAVLEKMGFIHHCPLVRGGRHLDGQDFCEEMNKRYHNGERIFAHVGRLHVAAIVPVSGAGRTSYKIIDSWDSSARLIGEYWVLPAKTYKTEGTATESKGAKNKKEPRIGRWLNHPTFGEGVITEVAVGVLTVDFGEKGFRRLGEDWVHKHCFISEARMDHKCQRIAQKGR